MTDEAGEEPGDESRRSTMALNKDTEAVCRICYETSNKTQPLISPCKCTGTLKYVHEECLKTWVLARQHDVVKSRCELCTTELKMQLDIKLMCKFRGDRRSRMGRVFHYLVITVILAGLFTANYVLIDQISSTDGTKKSGLIVGLIVTCFLILLMIILLVSSILADSRCIHQLNEWRILERQAANPTSARPTDASRNHTYQPSIGPSEVSAGNLPEYLVLAQTTQARGRTVEMPEVSPLLTRVHSASSLVQVYVAFPSRTESLAASFVSL